MKKYLLVSLLVFIFGQISACTIFTASSGKSVLVGNNEDYSPGTKSFLWVRPGTDVRNGYIFWGFREKYPEGGMNDKGLFIDAAALPEEIAIKRDTAKPDFKGYLTEKILKECASVADVIAFVGKYNLTWQQKAQIMVVDKSGDYAIIHANYIIRKEAPVFALTNFAINVTGDSHFTCWRKNTAIAQLTANPISVDLFRDILSKTAQRQPDNATVYSQVCDLSKGIVYLYQNHNFQQVDKISLDDILKKGRHNILISSIFPRSISRIMERKIERSAITKALKLYQQLKESPGESAYDFSENELDDLGYQLLNRRRFKEAIAVFKLNKEVYPMSANAVAGLANAFLLGGATELAETLYRKAGEMDSWNPYVDIFKHKSDNLFCFRVNGFNAANHIQIYLKNLRSHATISTELNASIPGQWAAKINLPPGEYSYSYKVDDSWMVDPNNKLTTRVGQYANSYLISR
jgi:tetratricopeptide (TPR) repeat protein